MFSSPADLIMSISDAIATVEAGGTVDVGSLRHQVDEFLVQIAEFDGLPTGAAATMRRFGEGAGRILTALEAGDVLGAHIAFGRAMGFPSVQIPVDVSDLDGGDAA